MQEGCLPPSQPLLPLITAWFLLPSLMSFMISSLWQKCSTTLSCSIMNGHIWSCKYLHLWAHPGKRYKKCDLSKHQKQPRDQVNHTPPTAVPLLFLFLASLVLYLRERRWQSLASDFLLFPPKLLQERSQRSYIRCAQLIWLHLSFSPLRASGEQQAFLAHSLFNHKEGSQKGPAEALSLGVPVSLQGAVATLQVSEEEVSSSKGDRQVHLRTEDSACELGQSLKRKLWGHPILNFLVKADEGVE